MGRKPFGTRPLTNAEKQRRKHKRAMARNAARKAALQEIVRIRDMPDMPTLDRMLAMAATAEKALTRDDDDPGPVT